MHIIEDHPIIADGIRQRLRHDAGQFSVTGISSSVPQFLSATDPSGCDMVILDLWIPGSDPVENLLAIRDRCPEIPVVIFTQESSPWWIRTMIESGARAYILKTADSCQFRNLLEQAFRGDTVVPSLPALEGSFLPGDDPFPDGSILKPSERAILQRLAGGATMKAIARERSTTVSAIEKTLKKLRKLAGAKTNPELIRIMVMQKII